MLQVNFFDLAFPYPNHIPPYSGKVFRYLLVSPNGSFPLFCPILFVLLRASIPEVVTIPETPIGKNDGFQFGESEIRFPGKGVVASPTFHAVGLKKDDEANYF